MGGEDDADTRLVDILQQLQHVEGQLWIQVTSRLIGEH